MTVRHVNANTYAPTEGKAMQFLANVWKEWMFKRTIFLFLRNSISKKLNKRHYFSALSSIAGSYRPRFDIVSLCIRVKEAKMHVNQFVLTNDHHKAIHTSLRALLCKKLPPVKQSTWPDACDVWPDMKLDQRLVDATGSYCTRVIKGGPVCVDIILLEW